jgi:hypothetical protein
MDSRLSSEEVTDSIVIISASAVHFAKLFFSFFR